MRDDPTDVAATAADVLATVTGNGAQRVAPWHEQLTDGDVAFLRALVMPAVRVVTRHTPNGPELLLADPGTGSWVRARRTAGGAELAEHGPRRLYDELAALAIQWDQHGRPTPDRYGLSVTAEGQHTLWLDDPSTPVTTL
jgi:hypothetical protein